jgi:hypothetical protein
MPGHLSSSSSKWLKENALFSRILWEVQDGVGDLRAPVGTLLLVRGDILMKYYGGTRPSDSSSTREFELYK